MSVSALHFLVKQIKIPVLLHSQDHGEGWKTQHTQQNFLNSKAAFPWQVTSKNCSAWWKRKRLSSKKGECWVRPRGIGWLLYCRTPLESQVVVRCFPVFFPVGSSLKMQETHTPVLLSTVSPSSESNYSNNKFFLSVSILRNLTLLVWFLLFSLLPLFFLTPLCCRVLESVFSAVTDTVSLSELIPSLYKIGSIHQDRILAYKRVHL